MPYDERDERDMGYDERADLFEQDPAYSTDTYFGERLDNSPEDDVPEVEVADPEYADEFGETMIEEPAEAPDDPALADESFDDEQDEMSDKTAE